MPNFIEIKGAKVHNLKNINVSIPLNKLVAIVGVSGSGKSSLALGVLYAEGSRRYLDGLSTYTRRRISQIAEAKVTSIENIPASLALRQRPPVPNIRSTFGTSTELLNSLRLIYSRLGSHQCPNGHYQAPTINVAADKPIVCSECHESFWGPSAESFAFNSEGACENCSGLGIVQIIDDSKLIPDQSKSLQDGAVEVWNSFGISWMFRVAAEMGVRVDVPVNELTQAELEIIYSGPSEKRIIMIPSKNGKLFELNCTYRNAHKAVEETLNKAENFSRIEKYLISSVCPKCKGTRLNYKARSSLLCGINLAEASNKTLEEIINWIKEMPNKLPTYMQDMTNSLCKQFLKYTDRLIELGLGYLTLDRASYTLSTGERQRVQLAKSVRNKTTGILYVLDEPSIGLHPSNIDGLLGVIRDLLTSGNSVILVDHDTRLIKKTDYIIEMGEEAGIKGGRILATGTVNDIINNKNSKIGSFLSEKENIIVRPITPANCIFDNGAIILQTKAIHTVNNSYLKIPKKKLTAITGVSGAGKTTLILESLVPAIKAKLNNKKLPEHVVNIELCGINKIHLIDATPIGVNVRSTVATYCNILDSLRKLFSSEKYTANDLSYNTGRLRCSTCEGTGQISMDVQFLPDVNITCPDCNGTRYSKEANNVKYIDISLPEVINLTIEQAINKFKENNKIHNKLQILNSMGLGYLTLGEATTALSGGEAQRLKLALQIDKSQSNAIFIFDEPSIGLHPLDVRNLIIIFQKLIDKGATVVVIEHDVDLIKNADYVIDMNRDKSGGKIVACGTPTEIANNLNSITGIYLK